MSTELKTFNLVPPNVLEAYGAEGNRLNFNDIYKSTHVNVQVPHYVGMSEAIECEHAGQTATISTTRK